MTQAGRQGSPRNSSGRNSSGPEQAARATLPAGRQPAEDSAAVPAAAAAGPGLRRRPAAPRTQTARGALRRSGPGGHGQRPAAPDADKRPGRRRASLQHASPAPRRRRAPLVPRKPNRAPAGAPAQRLPGLRQRTLRPEPGPGAPACPQEGSPRRRAPVGPARLRRRAPAKGDGLRWSRVPARLRRDDRRGPG